jgi:hypothetical protein
MKRAHDAAAWGPADDEDYVEPLSPTIWEGLPKTRMPVDREVAEAARFARFLATGKLRSRYHVRVGLSNEPDSISRGPDVRLSPGVGAVRVTEAKP